MSAWLVRLWPTLAAVGAIIAVALWIGSLTDAAYEQCVSHERTRWEQEVAKAYAECEARRRLLFEAWPR